MARESRRTPDPAGNEQHRIAMHDAVLRNRPRSWSWIRSAI